MGEAENLGSAGSCLKNFSFERLLRGFNESLPAWQTLGPDDVELLKARVPLGSRATTTDS